MTNAHTQSLATLSELYARKMGKVSDKWASYLRLYEQEFLFARRNVRSLLEIGVQNGGSLEIWAEYFPSVEKVLGCDINPRCAALQFSDPRIRLTVGDATSPTTVAEVLRDVGSLDVVIEDGSHIPRDVIAAFQLYWPKIRPGGVFIAEDLSCDYFPGHEGSITRKDTANCFFAQLVHLINHEHWAGVVPIESLFAHFKFNIPFTPAEWVGTIASISFHNSVVIVRKAVSVNDTLLGDRVVAGDVATVDDAVLSVRATGQSSLLGLHERPHGAPAGVAGKASFANLFR